MSWQKSWGDLNGENVMIQSWNKMNTLNSSSDPFSSSSSSAFLAATGLRVSPAPRPRPGRPRPRFEAEADGLGVAFFGLFRFSVIFVFRVASLAFALLLATLVRSGVFRCRFFDLKTYDNQMNEKWQILNEDAKIVKILSTKLSFL